MLGDPGTGGERVDEGLVEAAAGAVPVDVFERGLAAEIGLLQAAAQLALLALGPLGVHEQAEAVLEAEGGELGIAQLPLAGLGEGRQAQGHQFVEGGVSKHRGSSGV